MTASSRFRGKTAVVSGAGHGIGRACAHSLAREGATVAVCDVMGERAHETVKLCGGLEGATFAIVSDVSDEASVGADEVVDRAGVPDIVHTTRAR